MRINRSKLSDLWKLIFCGLCTLSSQRVFGSEINKLLGDVSPPTNEFVGEVGWEAVRYLTALPEMDHLNSSQFLSADLNYYSEYKNLSYAFDASAGSFVEFGSSTFTIDELYAAVGSKKRGLLVSFGRKRLPWNLLDQEWQLGVYQPVYNYDPIHPVDQGLTGLFLEMAQGPFRFAARVSPLFIPSQGAPIENTDGELSAPSRFFKPPSGSTTLIGQPTRINYDLEIDDFSTMLVHPGYSILMGYGDPEDNGLWGQVSFSEKPNPFLLISYDGFLSLRGEEPAGDVTVSPYVAYHRLYSGDLGFNFEGFRTWVSVLADEPSEGFFNETWARQEVSALQAYALNVSFPGWTFRGRSGFGDLSYLRVEGGESKTINSPTEGGGDLFGSRVYYKEAIRLRLASGLTSLWGRPLSTRLKWLWDFETSGLLMSTEFQYVYQESVALVMGFDMIGIVGGTEENTSPDFFNQYRSNDRVYGGLSYVF